MDKVSGWKCFEVLLMFEHLTMMLILNFIADATKIKM